MNDMINRLTMPNTPIGLTSKPFSSCMLSGIHLMGSFFGISSISYSNPSLIFKISFFSFNFAFLSFTLAFLLSSEYSMDLSL